MNIRRWLLTAFAASALVGCGLSQIMPDTDLSSFLSKTGDVDFDMTESQVQYYMGAPRKREYQHDQEAWLWCQTSNSPKRPDAFLVVYFYRARVAGIHSYANHAEGQCEDFFRPVEWLVSPEREMAAKRRRRE